MKCHSKRSVSRGEARKKGEGWLVSSWASFKMRRMVGDLEFILGVAGVGMVEDGERRC